MENDYTDVVPGYLIKKKTHCSWSWMKGTKLSRKKVKKRTNEQPQERIVYDEDLSRDVLVLNWKCGQIDRYDKRWV